MDVNNNKTTIGPVGMKYIEAINYGKRTILSTGGTR